MIRTFAAILALGFAAPAFADGHLVGDPAEGEKQFNKCKACHMIVADDGTAIVKGGKTGPNLYGIMGRTAGVADFNGYGDSLVEAGAAGLVWDQENLSVYIQDPRTFLQETLGDKGAKSRMAFKMRKNAEDVAAYLFSVAPAES
ncbi:MAG: cytochrome C [Pseudomonadota bacterium]